MAAAFVTVPSLAQKAGPSIALRVNNMTRSCSGTATASSTPSYFTPAVVRILWIALTFQGACTVPSDGMSNDICSDGVFDALAEGGRGLTPPKPGVGADVLPAVVDVLLDAGASDAEWPPSSDADTPVPHPQVQAMVLAAGNFVEGFDVDTYTSTSLPSIAGVDEGDWVRFDAVDFGSHCAFDSFEAVLTTPNDGNRVLVHLDALHGPIAAQIIIEKTGDDFSETQMAAQRTPMAVTTGVHKVFIEFAGPPQQTPSPASGIGNFRSFSFIDAQQTPSCEAKGP